MGQSNGESEGKALPIAFAGAMVRAVLEGRKTQTRRVVQPQPDVVGRNGQDHPVAFCEGQQIAAKYGLPGDRLWVRERFAYQKQFTNPQAKDDGPVVYATDPEAAKFKGRAWRQSRHMPRSISRILLNIQTVRIERLNKITPADARAEGFDPAGKIADLIQWFRLLWNELTIDSGQGWDVNPWVWVVSFKVHSVGR